MGQKVNPISNRLGIIRGWDSNWYGGKNYGDTLLEDSKIRKYLNARLAKASVSRIVIVQDFPLRGKKVFLNIRRRRWLLKKHNEYISRNCRMGSCPCAR